MKLYILLSVGWRVKWDWISSDCEERRRFMYRTKHCLVSPKAKKGLELTQDEYEQLKEHHTYYSYSPYFPSLKAVRSQLQKNNREISMAYCQRNGEITIR